ncbi:MAG: SDR family oxidoreductase [Planctomycetes bacterium]|nr:SDR family oxidoreductase [Planctomycetota bacterium]
MAFSNKTVLITGASSGIGRAMAHRFARDGARLVLVARRGELLNELATELGNSAVCCPPIVEDLAQGGSCERVVERLKAGKICVDVLVNNAGIGEYGEFRGQNIDTLEGMMRLNMNALVRLTHLVLPDMIARRHGHILNVASTAAFQPTPYMGVYGATKSFVLNYSMSLWYELRKHGIGVTCLCPGPVRTEFFNRESFSAQRQSFLKTAMTAEAVADCAVRGLAAKRCVVVPGIINKITALAPRFSPLRLVTRVAAKLLKPVRPSV